LRGFEQRAFAKDDALGRLAEAFDVDDDGRGAVPGSDALRTPRVRPPVRVWLRSRSATSRGTINAQFR